MIMLPLRTINPIAKWRCESTSYHGVPINIHYYRHQEAIWQLQTIAHFFTFDVQSVGIATIAVSSRVLFFSKSAKDFFEYHF